MLPDFKNTILSTRYNTQDIINAIVLEDCSSTHAAQTADTVPTLNGRSERESVRNLFDFLDKSVRYDEDGDRYQHIKTPSRLIADGYGDCKSFTLYITSVLQNWHIPYFIRFVSFDGKDFNHVYPIAVINGENVALDVVYQKQSKGLFRVGSKFGIAPTGQVFARDYAGLETFNKFRPNSSPIRHRV